MIVPFRSVNPDQSVDIWLTLFLWHSNRDVSLGSALYPRLLFSTVKTEDRYLKRIHPIKNLLTECWSPHRLDVSAVDTIWNFDRVNATHLYHSLTWRIFPSEQLFWGDQAQTLELHHHYQYPWSLWKGNIHFNLRFIHVRSLLIAKWEMFWEKL